MNFANKLTILRMALTPVFIACFYLPTDHWPLIALLVFIAAYATDVADGQYARRRGLVTSFGKLMDPIADKVLTAASFVMLNSVGLVSPIVTVAVLAREFVISGFRLVAAGGGNVIAASWLGKIKTVSQFIGAALVLLAHYLNLVFFPGGEAGWVMGIAIAIVWISVFFTIWSGIDYIARNRRSVSWDR